MLTIILHGATGKQREARLGPRVHCWRVIITIRHTIIRIVITSLFTFHLEYASN